mgnify:CR=1 FL=1
MIVVDAILGRVEFLWLEIEWNPSDGVHALDGCPWREAGGFSEITDFSRRYAYCMEIEGKGGERRRMAVGFTIDLALPATLTTFSLCDEVAKRWMRARLLEACANGVDIGWVTMERLTPTRIMWVEVRPAGA